VKPSVAIAAVLLVGAVTLPVRLSWAQVSATTASEATAALGRGVAELRSGSAARAEQHLEAAIALAPRDPRGYYFQALALKRQGRSSDAEAMMHTGAMIEAQHGGAAYRIDQALEHFQGAERLAIETARRDARQSHQQSRVANQQARYAALEQRQALVQRSSSRLPLAAFANNVTLAQARAIAADASDPFADDGTAQLAGSATGDDNAAPAKSSDDSVFDAFAGRAPAARPRQPAAADNPFAAADDSAASPAGEPIAADIPEAARGTIKASGLLSIFGRSARSLGGMAEAAGNAAGDAMQMGRPGMGPGGDEFGEFGEAGGAPQQFGGPARGGPRMPAGRGLSGPPQPQNDPAADEPAAQFEGPSRSGPRMPAGRGLSGRGGMMPENAPAEDADFGDSADGDNPFE
jgi:hypothetical protein